MHTMVQEGQPGDRGRGGGGGGGVTQGEVGAYFKYIGGGGCPVGGQLITWGESTKLCYIADYGCSPHTLPLWETLMSAQKVRIIIYLGLPRLY